MANGITDAPPLVEGILETALYVERVDTSVDFYVRVFGFQVMQRSDRLAALAVAPSQVLLLFAKGGSLSPSILAGGTIPPHDGAGDLHMCFRVSPESLGSWEAHLQTAGVSVESRMRWTRGGASLYFRDPDGHSIELATPGVWPNY